MTLQLWLSVILAGLYLPICLIMAEIAHCYLCAACTQPGAAISPPKVDAPAPFTDTLLKQIPRLTSLHNCNYHNYNCYCYTFPVQGNRGRQAGLSGGN